MRHLWKLLFSSVMAFILMFSVMPIPANAVTNDANGITSNQIKSSDGDEFEIPTMRLGEKQSRQVVLSNGEIGVMTVEKIADLPDEEDTNDVISYRWIHWGTRKKSLMEFIR